MNTTPFKNSEVEARFDRLAPEAKERLIYLRELIFETAAETDGVGELEETLRWGEPAYLTSKSKSGSMIRLNAVKDRPDTVAMYVLCQTTLVDTWRNIYSDVLSFEGNRAIIFPPDQPFQQAAVKHCIALALRYRLDKKK